jgi:hypothetical protein
MVYTTDTFYTDISATTSSTTAGIAWVRWVDACTCSGTTAWPSWTSATSTTVSTEPWPVWVIDGRQSRGAINRQLARFREQTAAPYVPRKKTDAEVQAELRAESARRLAEEERRARELAVKTRAEKLLFDHLSPEQRDDLAQKKCFYLYTKSGRKYRIDRHTHGNVYLLDERGDVVRKFCAQPPNVPADDAILAQKLQLEADEESFLRVANATPIRR